MKNIKEFIANKKAEINNEWEGNQKDEWTNGYYNALSDIEQALSQHDVIKNEVAVCDCGNWELEAYSPCCSLSCWEDKFS